MKKKQAKTEWDSRWLHWHTGSLADLGLFIGRVLERNKTENSKGVLQMFVGNYSNVWVQRHGKVTQRDLFANVTSGQRMPTTRVSRGWHQVLGTEQKLPIEYAETSKKMQSGSKNHMFHVAEEMRKSRWHAEWGDMFLKPDLVKLSPLYHSLCTTPAVQTVGLRSSD